MTTAKKTIHGVTVQATKVATYNVERTAVYSGTSVKGQTKTLTVWSVQMRSGNVRQMVSIGSGALRYYGGNHEMVSTFNITDGSNQCWDKV